MGETDDLRAENEALSRLVDDQAEALKECLKRNRECVQESMESSSRYSKRFRELVDERTAAQMKLDNYIKRTFALKEVVEAKLSAARNALHDANQTGAPNIDYLAGVAATIFEFSEWVIKTFDTDEPLPPPPDPRQN